MDRRIAVLAGTPVDTRMGVEFLRKHGVSSLAFPISPDPREQTTFQILPMEEKMDKVRQVLRQAQAQGCEKAYIYCNSLSAAVDFPTLAEETGMRIVTPLDAYRVLASCYRKLAFVAAYAQGLAGIEKVLMETNPEVDLLGASTLPVVLDIEAGLDPMDIIRKNHLVEQAAWFKLCGAEALVLGCTHFPYLKDTLNALVDLVLIDPAEEMLRLLRA